MSHLSCRNKYLIPDLAYLKTTKTMTTAIMRTRLWSHFSWPGKARFVYKDFQVRLPNPLVSMSWRTWPGALMARSELADKSDLWNPAFQAMRRRRLLKEVRRGTVKVMRTMRVTRLRSCLVKVLSTYNRLSLISSSGSSIARLAKKNFYGWQKIPLVGLSKRHCQRHMGPKALSTLTNSTYLVQSKSFNKH